MAPYPSSPAGWLLRSIRGPPGLVHLAGDRPGVRHRTHVPELVRVLHRADRLDPPVEYVKRQGAEDPAVTVAEDRARLAVHFVRLQRHLDPGEPGEDGGKHPGGLLGADDAPGQLRGLAAAVPDQLNVIGEQLPQPVDVAFPERVEEPRRQFLPLLSVGLEPGAAYRTVSEYVNRRINMRENEYSFRHA